MLEHLEKTISFHMTVKCHLQMVNVQIGKFSLKYMQVQTEKRFLFGHHNTNKPR